ncbi:MAG: AbrB/MazE/SpoVT family DNA-binding domain-containing protein [Rectinemataceae bacterium]
MSLVQVGNSKGIRLPKSILDQCQIEDKLEMEVTNNEIILKPVKNKPREKWAEKFRKMSEKGDDALLINDSLDLSDKEWEW